MSSTRTLAKLAEEAKIDLCWLAALHQVLHERKNLCGFGDRAREKLQAVKLDVWFSDEVTCDEGKRFKSVFEKFRTFCKTLNHNQLSGEAKPGGYLNKAAVVYAVAILENFVYHAFEQKFKDGALDGFSSLNGYISVISGQKRGTGKVDLKEYIKDFDQGVEPVLYLTELRHSIVHNHGLVDEKLINAVNNLPSDDSRWDEHRFFNRRTDSEIWLHIVKVIIPLLGDAFDFVERAEQAFA